jgi:hypothetical protein
LKIQKTKGGAEMHKKDLINGLKQFIARDGRSEGRGVAWKGQRVFANFLIYYLGKLNIPSDEKYDFWQIEPYLPELMVDAFERLRTETDDETIRFRKEYESEKDTKFQTSPTSERATFLNRGLLCRQLSVLC